MAKPITGEELKKENSKLKRMLALTANKLHEALNTMQPLVVDSKDEAFVRTYETGRNYIRRNFDLGTELKKKSKKGKKLTEEELFFESLTCEDPKGDKLFKIMRETYTRWHVELMARDLKVDASNLAEVPPELLPVWDGRQFGDLKKLETYFIKIAVYRGKKYQQETGEVLTQEVIKKAANKYWNNLLAGLLSDRVEPFLKKQKKISQIAYNLTNIIDQIKNGTGQKQSTGKEERRNSLDEAEREIALASGVDITNS